MENLTWFGVLLVTAGYVARRHTQVKKEDPPTAQLDASYEVDPTRWRHDGSQPLRRFDGNQQHSKDAGVLELWDVLAF